MHTNSHTVREKMYIKAVLPHVAYNTKIKYYHKSTETPTLLFTANNHISYLERKCMAGHLNEQYFSYLYMADNTAQTNHTLQPETIKTTQ